MQHESAPRMHRVPCVAVPRPRAQGWGRTSLCDARAHDDKYKYAKTTEKERHRTMNVAQQLNDILVAVDCHQAHGIYAGIGSRKTPADVLSIMGRIATRLDRWCWVLRSGGADGADTAFANFAKRAELYVPWPGFNSKLGARLTRPSAIAMDIAAKYHPNWQNLSDAVQKLHARNVHQILGADCESPCTMVVCWTPDGSTGITTPRTGGTGQALRIAYDHKIPIFNLARQDHREAWEETIR